MEQHSEPSAEQERAADGCRRSLRRLRLQNGMAVLFVAMGSMIALVILDVIFSLESAAERTLIGNAFEAFKLIAVTVLGYIFGANRSKTGTED